MLSRSVTSVVVLYRSTVLRSCVSAVAAVGADGVLYMLHWWHAMVDCFAAVEVDSRLSVKVW